jgi:hypothetical protein
MKKLLYLTTALIIASFKLIAQTEDLYNNVKIEGSGFINGKVYNKTSITPGHGIGGIGKIEINETLELASTSVVDIELGSATNYDNITINGNGTFSGILNVTLVGGYVPTAGLVFKIINFQSYKGDFTIKNLPLTDGSYYWEYEVMPNGIEIRTKTCDLVLPITEVLFNSIADFKDINIATTGNWQITSPLPSWLTASQLSGMGPKLVKFTTTSNEVLNSVSRSFTVIVKVDNCDPKSFVIKQKGNCLSVASPIVYTASGGLLPINITTAFDWEYKQTLPTWLSSNPTLIKGVGNGLVQLTASTLANPVGRITSITLESKECDNKEITISQVGSCFTVAGSPLNYTAAGGTQPITITGIQAGRHLQCRPTDKKGFVIRSDT